MIFKTGSSQVKSLNLYIDLDNKIEKLTEWIYIFIVKISIWIPFALALIVAMVKYYILDLEAESFYLLCPTWYAIF